MICIASGKPLSMKPIGKAIAGLPVTMLWQPSRSQLKPSPVLQKANQSKLRRAAHSSMGTQNGNYSRDCPGTKLARDGGVSG